MKNRTIRFSRSRSDQAKKAMNLLADVDGIETMSVATSGTLRIRYDVRQLSLQILESALSEVGFELDNSIITKIKRGLLAYCEDTQRTTLGIQEAKTEHNSLSLSERVVHDPRPDDWRHYV